MELFFGLSGSTTKTIVHDDYFKCYLSGCGNRAILGTTRNKKAAVKFIKGRSLIEVDYMEDGKSEGLLRVTLEGTSLTSALLLELSS